MGNNLLAFFANPVILFLEICDDSSLSNLVFFQGAYLMFQLLCNQLGLGDARFLGFDDVL